MLGFPNFWYQKKKKNRVLAYKEAPNTSSKFNYDTLCWERAPLGRMSAGRASVGCGGGAGVGGPGLISAIGWVGTAGAEIAK